MSKPNTHKELLFKRQNGLCCWCGEAMGPLTSSIEHIIPRSFGYKNGGTARYENKALAHKLCNSRRGSDVTVDPHPDRLFEFVRQRLMYGRKFYVLSTMQKPAEVAPKALPAGSRIQWTCIILRVTPMGWVGMAGRMKKDGRARPLRVTPPYRNRIVALSDIEGAIR